MLGRCCRLLDVVQILGRDLGAHRCPDHFLSPSLKIWRTAGPTSCSASSQGMGISWWKGAFHSKLPSGSSFMQKRGMGREVKLLL